MTDTEKLARVTKAARKVLPFLSVALTTLERAGFNDYTNAHTRQLVSELGTALACVTDGSAG